MPCDWTRTSCAVWRKLRFYLATGASVCEAVRISVGKTIQKEDLLKMDMVDVFPIFPQQDADVVFASGNFHADLEEAREDRQWAQEWRPGEAGGYIILWELWYQWYQLYVYIRSSIMFYQFYPILVGFATCERGLMSFDKYDILWVTVWISFLLVQKNMRPSSIHGTEQKSGEWISEFPLGPRTSSSLWELASF